MSKSADAFRTISEVADWLGIPAHVLRFWESKFTQVKPVKRAGGRRYYRPADMQLLGGIRKLLHDDGMTIKGVQKMLRDQGIKYVSDMAPALDGEDLGERGEVISGIALDVAPEADTERGRVLSFQRAAEDTTPEPEPATPDSVAEPPEPDTPEPAEQIAADPAAQDSADAAAEDPAPEKAPEPAEPARDAMSPMPSFLQRPAPKPEPTPDETAPPMALDRADTPPASAGDDATAPEVAAADDTTPDMPAEPEPRAATPTAPRVTPITLPDDPSDDMTSNGATLARLTQMRRPLNRDQAEIFDYFSQRIRARRDANDAGAKG